MTDSRVTIDSLRYVASHLAALARIARQVFAQALTDLPRRALD